MWQSTLSCVVTLKGGGGGGVGEGDRVVFHVLYAYCQSYSDLRGYSDKAG